MKGDKKPWSKVGKLENRVAHLENAIGLLKADLMEEMNLRARGSNRKFAELHAKLDREIDLKEQILKEIRAAIDKILEGK